MTVIKRALFLIALLLGALMLSYYLPARDIVKIVGTDVKRMDVSDRSWFWDKADAGTRNNTTRDVRFISTQFPNGKPYVYRNEDTAWSFPFYFKFDSGDLNAQAQSLAKQDEEQWVAVRHYGWRSNLISIFPNAVSMKKVSGPDVKLFPIFNIVFLTFLAILFWQIWLFIDRFKSRHIDPVTDKIGDRMSDLGDKIKEDGESGLNRVVKAKTFIRNLFGK